MMEILINRPPMWAEINAAFDVAGKAVIFAWGNRIFNPANVHIGPELLAHETVHGRRQGDDVEGWWRRYIADPAFRLAEEIPAHQAEYLALIGDGNRIMRRRAAKHVAAKLASPLYGRLIKPGDGRILLKNAA